MHLLESPESTAGVPVGQVRSPIRGALGPPLALALPGYDLLRSTRHFTQAAESGHAGKAGRSPVRSRSPVALRLYCLAILDCARGLHTWACRSIRTASLEL